MVASARGRRAGARRPPRRAEHRHRVGQVTGLPAADTDGAGRESAGAGALPLADQGARARPAARGGIADRRGARTRRRRADALRRRQPRGGAPVRAGTVALDLLQPRHDPPVDAAQPRPLGGVPAQSAVRRRRRMPLLPRHFRFQRGDGAAPAAAAVRPVLGDRRDADRHLRQRDHGAARRPPHPS